MGEFSKYVGDVGEKIVNDFLLLFGWRNMCSNKELVCHVEDHDKTTHGIDALFVYDSPLQKRTINSIVVSAKYSSKGYEKIRSTFKDHMRDIVGTIDCYSKSDLKRHVTAQIKGSATKKDVGVLFYINNVNSDGNNDIKHEAGKARLELTNFQTTVYLVDNARAEFLFSALKFIKKKHDTIEFFCNSTSLNIGAVKNHTNIMPVEYITSPIIPMSVVTEKGRKFIFLCDFNFDKDSLLLVVKLAKSLCANFSNHYEIYFKTYNYLSDKPSVDEVSMHLLTSAGFNESHMNVELTVDTFNEDFRSAS